MVHTYFKFLIASKRMVNPKYPRRDVISNDDIDRVMAARNEDANYSKHTKRPGKPMQHI